MCSFSVFPGVWASVSTDGAAWVFWRRHRRGRPFWCVIRIAISWCVFACVCVFAILVGRKSVWIVMLVMSVEPQCLFIHIIYLQLWLGFIGSPPFPSSSLSLTGALLSLVCLLIAFIFSSHFVQAFVYCLALPSHVSVIVFSHYGKLLLFLSVNFNKH